MKDLLAWLETAELPPLPLRLITGVEAYNVEHLREQLLSGVPRGEAGALLKLRYLAARYGPPEIRALARPEDLGEPTRRQD